MFVSEKEREETIRACRFCPMCYHADTVVQVLRKETNSPRGRALTLFAIDRGMLDWSDEAVESMYQYSCDGLDQEWCVGNYDHDELILSAREEIVRQGKAPAHVRAILDNLRRAGNPWGAAETRLVSPDGNGETLAFLGCTARLQRRALGSALHRIGEATGEQPGLFAQENCCGMLAYLLGDVELAKAQVEAMTLAVRRTGAKRLVVLEADCYRFLQLRSRRFGVQWPEGFEILHSSEWLAHLVSARRLQLKAPSELTGKTVAYHDPCSLARFTRVIDPPRLVLGAIADLKTVEFARSREKAGCCGAGGALLHTYPDLAKEISARRWQEARDAGAEVIVSASPTCEQMLEQSGDGTLPVLDLLEVVARSLCGVH
jgi:Fe-S oxidoreductase